MRRFLKRLGVVVIAGLMSTGFARAETIMVNSSFGGIYVVEVETLAVTEIAQAPQFLGIIYVSNNVKREC